MEGHGDTGRNFDNAENNNPHKTRIAVDIEEYSRPSGKKYNSRIGPNGRYIEYEPKKKQFFYININER